MDNKEIVRKRFKKEYIWKQYDYLINIDAREFYLQGDIDETSIVNFRSNVELIIKYSKSKKPITILIDSNGGDLYSALGIIDYIETLKEEDIIINTKNIGRAMSAAALILVAGSGTRTAVKRSTIMFHEFSSWNVGKMSELKSGYKHIQDLEKEIITLLVSNTTINKKEWEDKLKTDMFLTSREALEKGIIDEIS